MKSYTELNLVQIDKRIYASPEKVHLTGTSLTIPEIVAVARRNEPVDFTPDATILKRIQKTHEMMIQNVEDGIPIYGCNTGYGAQASHVLNKGSKAERLGFAKKISEAIAHIDVSVGPVFSKEIVRSAMLIRINMLMQGVSAIKLEDLDIYRKMLNNQITPIVNQYGGIGASGDLAHNCRVLNAARQMKGTKVWDKKGRVRNAKSALSECNIKALDLDPKAGLGFVNGDNFSTAAATMLTVDTLRLLLISNCVGAMAIEALKGTDRSFHPMLSELRPHKGQKEASAMYRYLLKDSQLAYQEMKGHKERSVGIKVQDGYSLRCLSQYHAVNFEKIKSALDTITINANSVSDNPLWVPPHYAQKGEDPWQWVSGGNFIAMHMVEVIDGIRKTLTQIVKLNDRHLARLVNPHENNGLPANLSDKKALSQCAFKGTQIQSGMFDVYSMLLSIPVSTFFGVHEEANQDITSHALTSGILGLENLKIARYSTAQNLIAVVQAIDIRGGVEKLSPKTKPLYEFVRKHVRYVKKERPLHNEIEYIYQTILSGELMKIVREKIFNESDYGNN
jgi:histidine ammonia-lyase